MSSDRIYLTSEEQIFLMEMLELNDPTLAAEKFVTLMVLEKADPTDMKKYLQKILKKFQ